MKNAEFVQKLKEIGWVDNIAFRDFEFDNLQQVQQEILSHYSNPDRTTGELMLTEACFDEENLYETYRILDDMQDLAKDDLDMSEIEELSENNYGNAQELFDDVNAILAKNGIKKAFYILPRIDQMVFYVYKPIEVYQKALELGLIPKS